MLHRHTHHDPEQLACTTAAESVARNAGGQSLDDARETFRIEWQAKIDRKRQQAAQVLGVADNLEFWAHTLAGGATAFGTLVGAVGGSSFGEFVLVVLWAVIGAVLGLIIGLVPMALGYGCAGIKRSRAARLEREAEELERS